MAPRRQPGANLPEVVEGQRGVEGVEQAVVGMGAIVLQRASLGAGAMLAAGAVLAERTEIRPRVLAAGVPAKEKKELSGSALAWTETAAHEYQEFRRMYARNIRERVA